MPPKTTPGGVPCPSSSDIDAMLAHVDAVFASTTEFDARQAALATFDTVPRACMTAEQAARLAKFTLTPPSIADELGKGGGLFGGIEALAFRLGAGVVGLVLIVLGLLLIAGEATLSSAAAKFGAAIRKGA